MSAPLQSALKSLVDKLNAHGKDARAHAVYGQTRVNNETGEKTEVLKVHLNPNYEKLGLRAIIPDEHQSYKVEIEKYWPIGAH